jgi:hypothetical protein
MRAVGIAAVLTGAALALSFWKTNTRCAARYRRAANGTWVLQPGASVAACPRLHLPAPEVLVSGKADDEAAVTSVHNRYLGVGYHVTQRTGSDPARVVSGRALFFGAWAGVGLAPLAVWLVASLAVGVGGPPREDARP